MKKFLSIVFLGLIITSNSMSYEEANYEVVKKNEVYEIRKYSDRLAIETDISNQSIFSKMHEKKFFIIEGKPSQKNEIVLIAAAPIFDPDKSSSITAFLMIHYNSSIIQDLLSGKHVLNLGAKTQIRGIGKTGETYLVNYNKLMITDSLFIKKSRYELTVNTKPVKQCIERHKENTGLWLDYRGVPVVGASMCINYSGLNWIILVEQDEKEAFLPIQKLRNYLLSLGFFIQLFIVALTLLLSKKLIQYGDLQIVQDESWELRMFLSKINQKLPSLFLDNAKNSLIESLFCCQKTKEAIQNSNVFAPCWQKCASFHLADAISSLNNQRSSPSHMLDLLRKLEKNSTNEHISIVTQTVGIERATPVLLERILKSTIGFSDLIEKNKHSEMMQQKHDFFVKNSMLSDCYFYLGYINKEIFVQIKDTLNRNPDLFHILKIAFDVEGDSNLLLQQSDLIQKSCNDILEIISQPKF